MMRKFSSITSSFTSVCWFSALFAICFFSFLYLHPREKCCVDIPNISTAKTTLSTTKHVSNETNVENLSSELGKDSKKTTTTTRRKPEVSSITSIIELPRTDHVGQPNQQASNATIIELVNSTTPIPIPIQTQTQTPTTPPITSIPLEEESEEDYNKIPSIDEFANPPWNISKEERIEWLKHKLEEYKIIKTTSRTINFEDKLQGFLNQGNNNICKVNIFLTWISPASLFGKRELLVLESILKAHPQGCVVILSRTMDSGRGWTILAPLLDRGHRIHPMAPDFHNLFRDTPAQIWLDRLESGEVDPGTVPITQNLSNLLRMVVLYKYGGVYFDTDMVILRDVSSLRNSIGIQSVDDETRTWRTLNNAVLIFDKEHPLIWKFMEEFANTFDGFTWGHNGPYLASRVVTSTLEDTNFQYSLLSPQAFYPVDWIKIPRLFSKHNKNDTTWAEDRLREIDMRSYGVHLWNKQTRNLKIEKKSAIGKLISRNCIICKNVYDS